MTEAVAVGLKIRSCSSLVRSKPDPSTRVWTSTSGVVASETTVTLAPELSTAMSKPPLIGSNFTFRSPTAIPAVRGKARIPESSQPWMCAIRSFKPFFPVEAAFLGTVNSISTSSDSPSELMTGTLIFSLTFFLSSQSFVTGIFSIPRSGSLMSIEKVA